MKKFLLLPFLIFLSCSDGDLQIETLDFDSAAIQYCDDLTVDTQVLFKINSDGEALILELASGLLKNEISTEAITSTIPSQSSLTYRIFTDNVTNDYFCADFPPVTPTVVEEIVAANGEITINTTDAGNGEFLHTIQLSNVTLLTGNNKRITNLTIDEFGEITTKIE